MVKKLLECCEDADDAIGAASYSALDAILDLGSPRLLAPLIADFMGTAYQVSGVPQMGVGPVATALINVVLPMLCAGRGSTSSTPRDECEHPQALPCTSSSSTTAVPTPQERLSNQCNWRGLTPCLLGSPRYYQYVRTANQIPAR